MNDFEHALREILQRKEVRLEPFTAARVFKRARRGRAVTASIVVAGRPW